MVRINTYLHRLENGSVVCKQYRNICFFGNIFKICKFHYIIYNKIL